MRVCERFSRVKRLLYFVFSSQDLVGRSVSQFLETVEELKDTGVGEFGRVLVIRLGTSCIHKGMASIVSEEFEWLSTLTKALFQNIGSLGEWSPKWRGE